MYRCGSTRTTLGSGSSILTPFVRPGGRLPCVVCSQPAGLGMVGSTRSRLGSSLRAGGWSLLVFCPGRSSVRPGQNPGSRSLPPGPSLARRAACWPARISDAALFSCRLFFYDRYVVLSSACSAFCYVPAEFWVTGALLKRMSAALRPPDQKDVGLSAHSFADLLNGRLARPMVHEQA